MMKIERTKDSVYLVLTHEMIGSDLQVTIVGGDEHHIGGTSLAYPTKSHYRDAVTVSVNTITVPGHKDYLIANSTAERICRKLGVPTLVTVGIHVDHATKKQIDTIIDEVDSMVDEMIQFYQKPE
ncbi:MAG: hypothetical protein ACFFEF_18410 [Candidatus Thorarchaeota archaeon]